MCKTKTGTDNTQIWAQSLRKGSLNQGVFLSSTLYFRLGTQASTTPAGGTHALQTQCIANAHSQIHYIGPSVLLKAGKLNYLKVGGHHQHQYGKNTRIPMSMIKHPPSFPCHVVVCLQINTRMSWEKVQEVYGERVPMGGWLVCLWEEKGMQRAWGGDGCLKLQFHSLARPAGPNKSCCQARFCPTVQTQEVCSSSCNSPFSHPYKNPGTPVPGVETPSSAHSLSSHPSQPFIRFLFFPLKRGLSDVVPPAFQASQLSRSSLSHLPHLTSPSLLAFHPWPLSGSSHPSKSETCLPTIGHHHTLAILESWDSMETKILQQQRKSGGREGNAFAWGLEGRVRASGEFI